MMRIALAGSIAAAVVLAAHGGAAGEGVVGREVPGAKADVPAPTRAAQEAGAKVILVTSGLTIPAEEARELGVYGYLRSPVRLSELELVLMRLAEWGDIASILTLEPKSSTHSRGG